ncbi:MULTISPECIES: Hsp20/alpha crystallin family protein [Leptospira]|uniref:Spore protein SP21 family protein n=8 Tax=Leptospira borgpetersenii TaxID=174 RepID=M3FB32_LEPBO|nr:MULTISPECIES: Hsp20/alpha crystallin family protein [Leptospira]EMF99097.1 spore protein SP21 family protein [Leptospira borgpetersenii str. 200701203]EMO11072.1 spore protein SP21 family protein [Leptospira borgpetersenii str. Noumea 25]EMO60214.1 spore protein SP21 family protein [Leptospira borgpetersenii serovar Pomona str. 200901868]ABJ75719.1 Small heat shock protein [Leptospira borgpetersenii serovar Hardjo-bovis str. JB197]ABJ78663.1 Small heat shock protein (molecular chaperone) [L
MTNAVLNQENRTEGHSPQEAKKERVKILTPRVDVYSDEENIYLLADLPGVEEKDVQVQLEKDQLTISGKTSSQDIQGELRYSEFRTGEYRRTFTLTESVEEDRISAVYKNGVLNLTLPKRKPLTKKIEVRSE